MFDDGVFFNVHSQSSIPEGGWAKQYRSRQSALTEFRRRVRRGDACVVMDRFDVPEGSKANGTHCQQVRVHYA